MEKFAQLLRKAERVLISTHAAPDGDGLGSEMALHFYCKKSGKRSYVVNTSPTPDKFQLVDPRGEIQVYRPGSALPPVDVVLVVDTSDWKMLGSMADAVRALKVPVIFIDHHVPEIEDVDHHMIDEQYASTGELVYEFLRLLRADIDTEIALAIYVSIVTDTSSFRFKRTTSRSHLIAAELLQKGISPEIVYQYIYARDSVAKIRLLGNVLEGIKASPDERIAWITIPRETRHHYGATIEDTESYVTHLTLMEGVEIGMMFREDDDGRIKVSLRGRGEIPVIGIAKKFGGGGHRHASGIRMQCSLDEAVKLVYREAKEFLDEFPPKPTKKTVNGG